MRPSTEVVDVSNKSNSIEAVQGRKKEKKKSRQVAIVNSADDLVEESDSTIILHDQGSIRESPQTEGILDRIEPNADQDSADNASEKEHSHVDSQEMDGDDDDRNEEDDNQED
jgi:hypothetical protein